MSQRLADPPNPSPAPSPRPYSDMPTLSGAQAVIAFARDELGVAVTRSMVRRSTEAGRLQVFKLSVRNTYSEQGVVNWIRSLARGGSDTGAAQ